VVFDENVFPFSILHPNAGARLRNEISLLSDNLTSCSSGDVLCHVPSITNSAVPRNFVEIQEQNDVQEVQEISEEEAMDPATTSDPGADPGVDLAAASPVEIASVPRELEPNGGSPRGG
jgi:hypothetical protein